MTVSSKQLFEEFAEGETFSSLARLHGLTIGQVAGRLRRYREKNGIDFKKVKKKGVYKLTPKKPKFQPTITLASFAEVIDKNTCRFIGGTDENPIYCGHARKPGSYYCEGHHKVCHRKTPRREQKI